MKRIIIKIFNALNIKKNKEPKEITNPEVLKRIEELKSGKATLIEGDKVIDRLKKSYAEL